MATTMFLIVLIVSLVIGNILLFFVGGRKQETQVVDSSEIEPLVISPHAKQVNLAPIEKKVELAHKRIQILERLIKDASSKGMSSSFKRRVEKLDNFRSTVEAEIIGIKEILAELQNINVTVKSRSFKSSEKKRVKKLSPKQLHRMVYKSTA